MRRLFFLILGFCIAPLFLPRVQCDQAGQPPVSISPEQQEGRAFVEELLSLAPPETVYYGVLTRTESSEGGRRQVDIRYATTNIDEGQWQANYEGKVPEKSGPEKLTIVHRQGRANQYRYTPDASAKEPVTLSGAEADIPFAGSDYWLSDLGLEFLHWPQQRAVKHKITMRNSRPCKVLESTNPNVRKGGYAYVLSWIDREFGALVYAEAYDHNRRRLKVFSLHGFKKVNNKWQPSGFQMSNHQTDSRSEIEFRFEAKP
jgi:hypothetical protein